MGINSKYTIPKILNGKKLWDSKDKVNKARVRGSRGFRTRVKFCELCGQCIKCNLWQKHKKECKRK